MRVELCAVDRPGLLSDITRTFRENGLFVTRAEVSTKGQMASNFFYVIDAAGKPADHDAIEAVRQRIGTGKDCLKVEEEQWLQVYRKAARTREEVQSGGGLGLFYLGNLVMRNLYNLGLIRSCS